MVDPLASCEGSVWYFVAAGRRRKRRAATASRASRARILTDELLRPALRLSTCRNSGSARPPSFARTCRVYRANARVRREIIARMPYAGRFARIEETNEPDADGWALVSLRFDAERCVRIRAQFRHAVEVLSRPRSREVCASPKMCSRFTRERIQGEADVEGAAKSSGAASSSPLLFINVINDARVVVRQKKRIIADAQNATGDRVLCPREGSPCEIFGSRAAFTHARYAVAVVKTFSSSSRAARRGKNLSTPRRAPPRRSIRGRAASRASQKPRRRRARCDDNVIFARRAR